MYNRSLTAAAALRATVVPGLYRELPLESILPEFFYDKGYDLGVVKDLARKSYLGSMLDGLFMRGGAFADASSVFEYFALRDVGGVRRHGITIPYTGTPDQNLEIDRVLTTLSDSSRFLGEGAGSSFKTRHFSHPPDYLHVPIAIVGYGAAGIMVHRALRDLGFEKITIFERREALGIWSQRNVFDGSRNNPRRIEFQDFRLDSAPGGGDEVKKFLLDSSILRPDRLEVDEIVPSDLGHLLSVKGKEPDVRTFPIVINCCGIGKPVPLSDPERMLGPDERVPAVRWQMQLEEKDARRKRFILIGLGNSTAEMLRQIHALQDEGVDVDYRVLTHYPRDAVFNPSHSVELHGRIYRVFRDLSRPELTSFQGDLPVSREDYYRALHGGRIFSGVTQWDVSQNGRLGVWQGNDRGDAHTELSYDALYALIGYRHSKESFEAMGCTYDHVGRCAQYDYDGEMIRTPGKTGGDRVHKGYFGFGAVLDAPHNRNTSVIPGMLFRLPDLIFGITMRAGEWVRRERVKH